MTLLIVNDVEMTIKFLTTKIDWKKYGISRLFTAYNADEAKEIFRDQEIDIILCDIEMPGENGISLIRWVRSQNFSTEIIFLTCHANFDYIQEALHLDCQDYVLFPQPANKIGEAVQKRLSAVRRNTSPCSWRNMEDTGWMPIKRVHRSREPTAAVWWMLPCRIFWKIFLHRNFPSTILHCRIMSA